MGREMRDRLLRNKQNFFRTDPRNTYCPCTGARGVSYSWLVNSIEQYQVCLFKEFQLRASNRSKQYANECCPVFSLNMGTEVILGEGLPPLVSPCTVMVLGIKDFHNQENLINKLKSYGGLIAYTQQPANGHIKLYRDIGLAKFTNIKAAHKLIADYGEDAAKFYPMDLNGLPSEHGVNFVHSKMRASHSRLPLPHEVWL